MLAKGNGAPLVCATNLIRTIRGEVPYERVKGISRAIIDKPASRGRPEFMSNVQWLIETYEPRLDVNNIDITALSAANGNFNFNTYVKGANQ